MDEALALVPRIDAILRQTPDEYRGLEDSFTLLRDAMDGPRETHHG